MLYKGRNFTPVHTGKPALTSAGTAALCTRMPTKRLLGRIAFTAPVTSSVSVADGFPAEDATASNSAVGNEPPAL